MPARMIDGDAIWTSIKVAACNTEMPATSGVYYPWIYSLADANGILELSSPRAVLFKIAANLPFLTEEHVKAILEDFHRNGLLFVWQEGTKTYGFWTKSDLPGRLPKPSDRNKYKNYDVKIPVEKLRKYLAGEEVATESRVNREDIAHGLVWFGLGREGKGRSRRDESDEACGKPEQQEGAHKTRPDLPHPERKEKTPQQHQYGNVSKLIAGAISIIAKARDLNRPFTAASIREDLKDWAAKNGFEYNSEMISQALDVAEARVKAHSA